MLEGSLERELSDASRERLFFRKRKEDAKSCRKEKKSSRLIGKVGF